MVRARRGEDVFENGWEGDTKKGDGKIEKDAEKTGGKAAEVKGDEENGDEERGELERRSEER
jgi:hypothetical protein